MNYIKKFGFRGFMFLVKKRLERYKKYKGEQLKRLPALKAVPALSVVGCVGEQSYPNIAPTGEYTAFISDGDILHRDALYLMMQKLLSENADAVYCDEDNFFKPDFSPNTLDSCNYIRSFIIKTEYADTCNFKELKTAHCDRVLIKSSKPLEFKTEAIAKVSGRVSIIIPSKDNYKALKNCVDSIRSETRDEDFEIIVVDNGSDEQTAQKCRALADKYIYEKSAFNFSYMCNLGAKAADGRFLLFLNDDTEVISSNWLTAMKHYAAKQKSGAVGAKLYYPNSTLIQHCGVINLQPGPAHAFLGQDDSELLGCGRNRGVWDYTAVTAACMMIERDKFPYFDESFAVAYNDTELCIRLLKAGLYNMVVNEVKLYHYESLSRGDDRLNKDKLKRLALERQHLFDTHPDYAGRDDFYNYNLTPYRADFSQRRYFESKYKLIKDSREGDFTYKIEYAVSGDRIRISGYAFNKWGTGKIYVLLRNEDGKTYRFTVQREMRTDIEAIYGREALLSGFCLNLQQTELPQGVYKVGIMLGGRSIYSDKEVRKY